MFNLKKWLILSLSIFLLLILINLGLPAIFLLMRVPSFTIGNNNFWIMEWSNTASGTSIRFNLMFLLAIAVVIALVRLLFKLRTKH
ncbi:hypothetical protein [Floridanema aerugineum]|uniref:Uncharacterized protein n=1 Tax=Floridaenema aerugineum BLCC-F46 TaxID=3153654 RepID=A0ABV4X1X9_9CYAN